MTAAKMIQRKKIFHYNLIDIVKGHHKVQLVLHTFFSFTKFYCLAVRVMCSSGLCGLMYFYPWLISELLELPGYTISRGR